MATQGQSLSTLATVLVATDPLDASPAISTTIAPTRSTEYATVNYNGLIGINATDPYAFTTESRSFELPTQIQLLMCLMYGTLAFTAVASNMIVCYIVLSNQRMRTATNYFIVNLAVGDILMAMLCIPFTFPANLIFQFWPFGLALCVVVSYSQANSVFISAYTMVAISIDKYLAIMYPMRLRMSKVQAKIIILVIWSAALVTSLPTALLSSLTPVLGESISSLPSTPMATTASPTTSTTFKSTQTLSNATDQLATTTTPTTTTPDNALQEDQPQKYFCQEGWSFWPHGKYYYSMTLMILQFVLPLFVLVITYTRIVIVVWGKRMPGEEDNARDARMARSKRKMIKMVIFCVIAFALTWLPFNILIVVGDLSPAIWENQNIMYIWFVTHYLAMCHTITNPLIYIWMNNRFRAGFKQVIRDLYQSVCRFMAYLCCYMFCCACLFECSHKRYARLSFQMQHKLQSRRAPLASTGSANAPSPGGGAGANLPSGFTGGSGGGAGGGVGGSATQTATTGGTTGTSAAGALTATTTSTTTSSGARAQTAFVLQTHNSSTSNAIALRSRATRARPITTERVGASDRTATDGAAELSLMRGSALPGTRMAGNAPDRGTKAAPRTRASTMPAPQLELLASKELRQSVFSNLAAAAAASTAPQASTSSTTTRKSASALVVASAAAAKKKRKKRQPHTIELQIISTEFRSALTATALATGALPTAGPAPTANVGRAETPQGCAQVRKQSASFRGKTKSGALKAKTLAKGSFSIDAQQSSQSTATISAQTNNTSLAISPLDSIAIGSSGAAKNSYADEPIARHASNTTLSHTSASSISTHNNGAQSNGAAGIVGAAANEPTVRMRRARRSQELGAGARTQQAPDDASPGTTSNSTSGSGQLDRDELRARMLRRARIKAGTGAAMSESGSRSRVGALSASGARAISGVQRRKRRSSSSSQQPPRDSVSAAADLAPVLATDDELGQFEDECSYLLNGSMSQEGAQAHHLPNENDLSDVMCLFKNALKRCKRAPPPQLKQVRVPPTRPCGHGGAGGCEDDGDGEWLRAISASDGQLRHTNGTEEPLARSTSAVLRLGSTRRLLLRRFRSDSGAPTAKLRGQEPMLKCMAAGVASEIGGEQVRLQAFEVASSNEALGTAGSAPRLRTYQGHGFRSRCKRLGSINSAHLSSESDEANGADVSDEGPADAINGNNNGPTKRNANGTKEDRAEADAQPPPPSSPSPHPNPIKA